MSLLERDTVMVSTDEEGNAVVDLPHTRANNVEGLGRSVNTYYSVGNVVYVDSNLSVALKCTTSGTTSNTELDISGRSVGDSVDDGGVAWKVIARSNVLDEGGVLPIANGGTGGNTFVKSASINGQDITLNMSDGTNKTLTTQDTNTGIVAQNLSANGYVKFSNGFTIQWGIGSLPSGQHVGEVVLPIRFDNAMYYVTFTDQQWNGTSVYDVNTIRVVRWGANPGSGSNYNSFQIVCTDSQIADFQWIAVGY